MRLYLIDALAPRGEERSDDPQRLSKKARGWRLFKPNIRQSYKMVSIKNAPIAG